MYDPSCRATVLAADRTERAGGSAYGWVHLHQGGRYDAEAGLYHSGIVTTARRSAGG